MSKLLWYQATVMSLSKSLCSTGRICFTGGNLPECFLYCTLKPWCNSHLFHTQIPQTGSTKCQACSTKYLKLTNNVAAERTTSLNNQYIPVGKYFQALGISLSVKGLQRDHRTESLFKIRQYIYVIKLEWLVTLYKKSKLFFFTVTCTLAWLLPLVFTYEMPNNVVGHF